MKRITLFAGHYGSGKTNLALNYALKLRESVSSVAIADLDIVNPYFRTKDSSAQLDKAGIKLVVSEFANSNVDFPALPKEVYSLVADKATNVVIDVGGDDRGALALGRYAPDILAENDYEMIAVINASRPLTRTPESALAVLHEIEAACGIRFTGIANNTNLGLETKAEDVVASLSYAQAISEAMKLPILFTAVMDSLLPALQGKVKNLFPLSLQRLYYMI